MHARLVVKGSCITFLTAAKNYMIPLGVSVASNGEESKRTTLEGVSTHLDWTMQNSCQL